MNENGRIVNPEDMRVRRTRKLLSGALIELMKRKPFSSISVTDICEEAMVHRTTFYSHFVDKYDLLRYAAEEKQREFEAQSVLDGGFESPTEFYVELFHRVIGYLRDNKQLFSSGNARNSGLEVQIARRMLADGIKSFIQKYRSNEAPGEVPPEVEAQCIAGAMMSLAAWWLEEGATVSEDELCRYVALLFRPGADA